MVIEFVTSRCNESHELARASLFLDIVAHVSDKAHGPLIGLSNIFRTSREFLTH